MMRRWPAVVLGASIALASPLAVAQSADPTQAQAQSLFNDALSLFDKGSYEAALKAFEDVNKKFPSVGALYKIGECYEKLGKPVAAWEFFKKAADTAHTKVDRQREEAAAAKAASLESKLPKLSVPNPVDGLEIRVNGELVKQERWNQPLLQGPGRKDIVASAPGHVTSTTQVTVSPEGSQTEIAVPALEKGGAGKGQRTIGLIVAGVGVAGLAVGGVFGLIAMGKKSDYNDAIAKQCPSKLDCTDDVRQKREDISGPAFISTVGFIAGGALLAGGAVLFLTAPKSREAGPPEPKAGVSKPIDLRDVALAPAGGPNDMGMSLSGRW